MAARLGQRKAGHVRSARPDIVTAGNMGCLVQMVGHLMEPGSLPPVTAHLVEILEASAAV